MKSGKRHMTNGMELTNHDKIRTVGENETYKYLGVLEADTIKQVEMKDKIRKENLRRNRKLLETKLSSRNLNKEINTWAVPLFRYSGPFLKSTSKGLLKGLEDLEVVGRVETIQTTALLRTARILRRVLETWGDLLSLKLQWKTIS